MDYIYRFLLKFSRESNSSSLCTNFFPSFLIPKTWQISLDNFIKKKPHISEDLQHKNQKGIVVAAPLIIIMLEARILIIIKIQESRAQKNDKHIYR